MLEAARFIQEGKSRGFDFYSGVPCSFLTPLINCAINDAELTYVAAANEGDAVAIASGASLGCHRDTSLGARRGVVMLQNSGLGNAVNPLTSLNFTFRIPIVLIVTLRGELGKRDEPQHELMGRITMDLLARMEVRSECFPDRETDAAGVWERARAHGEKTGLPYALLMRGDSVRPVELREAAGPNGNPERIRAGVREDFRGCPAPGRRSKPVNRLHRAPSRSDALELILDHTPGDPFAVISTTGYASRELFHLDDRPNHLYMVGSMGCASSLGLGLALRWKSKKVVVIDGDGALLMRMGSLATLGYYAPPNLMHIVLDNEAHESTGGQATVSSRTDFGRVAAACGYPLVRAGDHLQALRDGFRDFSKGGPVFVHLKIRTGVEGKLPRPDLSPMRVKQRFVEFLGAGEKVLSRGDAPRGADGGAPALGDASVRLVRP